MNPDGFYVKDFQVYFTFNELEEPRALIEIEDKVVEPEEDSITIRSTEKKCLHGGRTTMVRGVSRVLFDVCENYLPISKAFTKTTEMENDMRFPLILIRLFEE